MDGFVSPFPTPVNILHLNIRSIMKNLDELVVFLNELSLEFQMIVLSETFHIYDCDVIKISSYTTVYNEGRLNKNDGVVVYIKEGMDFTYQVKDICDIKIIEVNVKAGTENFIVTAIYRSPSTDPKRFNIGLHEYVQSIKRTDLHIIAGDTNIDLLSGADYVEEYKNILSSFGYDSYIYQ